MEEWMNLSTGDFAVAVGKLLLAGVLGGIIGWERERHGRWAGFRTHILVSLGACLMMLVSEFIHTRYAHITSQTVVRMDPSRIAAQIVTGIGFLGAGAIIKHGTNVVRGLTTAACLWVTAALGMAVGCGYIMPAIATVIVAMVTLLLLKHLDAYFRLHNYSSVRVEVEGEEDILEKLEGIFAESGLDVKSIGMDMKKAKKLITYEMWVRYALDEHLRKATQKAMKEISGITRIKFG